MLKQARQAAVVLLAAGFLAAGLPASGLPATSALAAAAAGARAIGARPAATGHVTAGPVGHVTAGPAALAPASPPANIYARGAELMNAVTGQRLWSCTGTGGGQWAASPRS